MRATAKRNVASLAAIPADYIDDATRAAYVTRATAGEDVYAYNNAACWIIWDGAITAGDRRVECWRRPGVTCGCCGALACICTPWRDAKTGLCLLHNWKARPC